ncbi:hypothetical protein RV14_GL000472 [Enterococcus ratti]|uniref:Uncharacterized protein n=1 Tax=Enterococcus ratti TaxID=150033 RepID=A0A1L8WI89_9ENTE|nr:hypothetical protein RV14_GL000472 [Enterococcus ratti]
MLNVRLDDFVLVVFPNTNSPFEFLVIVLLTVISNYGLQH